MKLREIILIISGISFIVFIVFLSLLLGEHLQVKSCGCPQMVSQNFIMLFIVLSVIFVGGIIYYLLSLKLEKKEDALVFNLNTVKKFLDKDEKKILNKLEKQKEVIQSDINLTRLRAHRALKKLEEKDIIKTEKKGRTKKVKLNENFKIK